MSGATAELNPNEGDTPGYGSLADGSVRYDQQVMGAQSIATAAQNIQEPEVRGEGSLQGFLDMDGETRPAPLDHACDRDDRQEPRGEQRNPEAPLNGVGPGTPSRGARHSRVGAFFSEMTAAVQGVVKAPPTAKAQVRPPTEGPGSAGTEGTVRTGASGYVTAVSEVEAADGNGSADVDQDFGGQAPLFSEEQAQRLESMTKAAPLLYQASGSAPELPHSVSSDSGAGEIIQQEVRRQLQQFVNVQTELERRVALLQRENEELRRGGVGPGMDQGVRGWLGGISRGISTGLTGCRSGAPSRQQCRCHAFTRCIRLTGCRSGAPSRQQCRCHALTRRTGLTGCRSGAPSRQQCRCHALTRRTGLTGCRSGAPSRQQCRCHAFTRCIRLTGCRSGAPSRQHCRCHAITRCIRLTGCRPGAPSR